MIKFSADVCNLYFIQGGMMKKRVRILTAAKFFAFLLAIVLCFASMCLFSACDNGGGKNDPPVFTPPETIPKVHSVSITYNGKDVEGYLSVDISQQKIKVGANVSKDDGADGSVKFASSNEGIAKIDAEGNVTLVAAGETVLTATCGGEKCSVVLSVGSGTVKKYTITVNGGKSDVTTASVGDIVTITPEIPVHKEFSDWSFAESQTEVTWISGNMFKMPAGDVTVSAEFADMLYSLKLVGAKVTSDGNEEVQQGTVVGYDGSQLPENAIREYKYAYETPLTFEAVEPSAGRMFVGWDENVVNNRLDEEEVISDFTMPDETTTYWANFSDIRSKSLFKVETIDNWDSKKLESDPELDGFSGFTVNIPGGTPASDGFNEDIQGSILNTVANPSQAIRALFRNRGDKPVTVEIYASFLTNLATSGWVTVPPGETVSKTFIALLGFQADPWWGFSVRENVEAGSSVPLDIVAGCADAYPKGDKTLSVSAGTKRVELENYTAQVGSALPVYVNNDYSWTLVTIYEHDVVNFPSVMSAKLNNLPEYNPEDPYITLYIKMQNQASSDHTYRYRFAFGKDENPLDEEFNLKPDSKMVDSTVSNHGETKLFAIRLPRSEADTNFYFSIIKLEFDTPDGFRPDSTPPYYALNFSVVLTYNNGIGFSGEVTE